MRGLLDDRVWLAALGGVVTCSVFLLGVGMPVLLDKTSRVFPSPLLVKFMQSTQTDPKITFSKDVTHVKFISESASTYIEVLKFGPDDEVWVYGKSVGKHVGFFDDMQRSIREVGCK